MAPGDNNIKDQERARRQTREVGMVYLLGLGIVAVVLVVVVFHPPGPDIVFASACTEEIMDAAGYLESSGVEASFKSREAAP